MRCMGYIRAAILLPFLCIAGVVSGGVQYLIWGKVHGVELDLLVSVLFGFFLVPAIFGLMRAMISSADRGRTSKAFFFTMLFLFLGTLASWFAMLGKQGVLWAARWGNPDILAFFLKIGGDPNRKKVGGGFALSEAVESASAQTVELLISNGAHVDTTDPCDRYNPLYLAYRLRHTEVIAVLQDHGAKLNCEESKQSLLLHHGYKEEDLERLNPFHEAPNPFVDANRLPKFVAVRDIATEHSRSLGGLFHIEKEGANWIQEYSQWELLQESHGSSRCPKLDSNISLNPDFRHKFYLVISAGLREDNVTTIQLNDIVELEDRVLIRILMGVPGKSCRWIPAPACLTKVYQIYKRDMPDKPVEMIIKHSARECG